MSALRIAHLARRALARRWALVGLGAAALLTAVGASQPASSATTPLQVTVSAAQPVYLVHAGQTAQPGLVLTTAGARSSSAMRMSSARLPIFSGVPFFSRRLSVTCRLKGPNEAIFP